MAKYIAELVPDAEVLLALEPEEIALLLLRIAETHQGPAGINPGNINKFPAGLNPRDVYPGYAQREGDVDLAIAEGWN